MMVISILWTTDMIKDSGTNRVPNNIRETYHHYQVTIPITTLNSSYLPGIHRRQNAQLILKSRYIWRRWCWTLKKKVAGICASHCHNFTVHGRFGGWGPRRKQMPNPIFFFYLRIVFWLLSSRGENKRNWGESGRKGVCILRIGSNNSSRSF